MKLDRGTALRTTPDPVFGHAIWSGEEQVDDVIVVMVRRVVQVSLALDQLATGQGWWVGNESVMRAPRVSLGVNLSSGLAQCEKQHRRATGNGTDAMGKLGAVRTGFCRSVFLACFLLAVSLC